MQKFQRGKIVHICSVVPSKKILNSQIDNFDEKDKKRLSSKLVLSKDMF
ncbi:hypothetical protein [Campylobacter sp. LH-2024]